MTPDASLDRSIPDYHEDRMSHDDDYYSLRRGLDWWDEKAANDEALGRRKDRLARRGQDTARWHALVATSHSS